MYLTYLNVFGPALEEYGSSVLGAHLSLEFFNEEEGFNNGGSAVM